MAILATSQHWPRYLSHHDVAIVGDILQHDVAIVEKSGDQKDARKRVTKMVMLSVRDPSFFLLFFHSSIFEFPARSIKKRGGRPTGPPNFSVLQNTFVFSICGACLLNKLSEGH